MKQDITKDRRNPANNWQITRRDFLKKNGAILGGLAIGLPLSCKKITSDEKKLHFVMATDAHYADTAARGERFYRESLQKMAECAALANDKKADFIIELGDFKDQNEPPEPQTVLNYLKRIESVFGNFKGPRYHVLGNHDTDCISKEEFLSRIENSGVPKKSKYYSFDIKKRHFVVLDANFRSDGSDYERGNFDWKDANIPPVELSWLKKDLSSAQYPVIVFVHQQLDGEGPHTIKNAAQVRDVLHHSGKVLAVFQGHNHSGAYSRIDGIHYYTLKAMVSGSGEENNSYALVELFENNDIAVTGYRRAESRKMERAGA